MTDLERLLIESQCKRLMTTYCLALDARDLDGFLSIFSEDGVWSRTNAPPIVATGHEGIRKMFAARQTALVNRHLMVNDQVTVLSEDAAQGICVGLIVDGPVGDGVLPAAMRGVELLVEYRDTFARTPDGWRITRRDMTRVIDAKSPLPQ